MALPPKPNSPMLDSRVSRSVFCAPRQYLSFWERVDKSGECWLWTGAVSSSGYGRAHWRGVQTTAQRRAYLELVGPIPDGLHLDHLCGVRRCVNPVHLEPVTRLENNRRSGNQNTHKVICKRGHALFGLNLYRYPDGRRDCRICRRNAARLNMRRYAAARKAQCRP
jgi:hypothetical protein